MPQIQTCNLTGPALDWAVAKCEGLNPKVVGGLVREVHQVFGPVLEYSTDWAQGGPIIEREGINTFKCNKLDEREPDKWGAHKVVPRKGMDNVEYSAALYLDGPTPLIAAMRCYVASKLGDSIDIPEELL